MMQQTINITTAVESPQAESAGEACSIEPEFEQLSEIETRPDLQIRQLAIQTNRLPLPFELEASVLPSTDPAYTVLAETAITHIHKLSENIPVPGEKFNDIQAFLEQSGIRLAIIPGLYEQGEQATTHRLRMITHTAERNCTNQFPANKPKLKPNEIPDEYNDFASGFDIYVVPLQCRILIDRAEFIKVSNQPGAIETLIPLILDRNEDALNVFTSLPLEDSTLDPLSREYVYKILERLTLDIQLSVNSNDEISDKRAEIINQVRECIHNPKLFEEQTYEAILAVPKDIYRI